MQTRILFIVEAMGGGVRRHVVDLIKYLDKDKFDMYLIYSPNRADKAFNDEVVSLSSYCKIIENPFLYREINITNDVKAYREIAKEIKLIKPDIVHCHSAKAGVLGRLASKIKGVDKIFYTPHAYAFQANEFSNPKKKFFTYIERVLSKWCTTKTFNVSKGELQSALNNKIDKKNKFKVIYNGLPKIDFPEKNEVKNHLGISGYKSIIGTNGRLNPQKNPLSFFRIAKRVTDIRNDIAFVWIGDGPLLQECIDYINENDLSQNVFLLGFRNDAEKVVKAFDLFLLTSIYEGLPYAPIEALRAEVPVIASNVVGNNEIVKNSINGVLYTREQEAVNNIIDLVTGKTNINYNDLKLHYKKNFSIDTMIQELESQYLKYRD